MSYNNYFKFDLRRKPITPVYNNVGGARNYAQHTYVRPATNVMDISSFNSWEDLDPYFRNPGARATECVQLSETLYATNRIYQNLLSYLANMFYWRTVTIPRKITRLNERTSKEDYNTFYHKMLEVTDGFNTNIAYPEILLNLFKNGIVFLYAYADKTSKTLSIIMLPTKYCSSTVNTQFGTTQVKFNFEFFRNIAASSNVPVESVLELFPEEFTLQYADYLQDHVKWRNIDPRFSTALALNDEGFPTFLSVFYDLIDYKTYKMNELDRSTNSLERIITQEIDLDKSHVEMPEVEDLHQSIAEKVEGNGTTLITSVGKLDVKQVQSQTTEKNEALETAYQSIFNNAGFNKELFAGDTDYALEISFKKDMNFVWKYVEKLVNFYNLAANNAFKFGPYQISFRVLPISSFNETEKLNIYRQNATLGVNIVDLFVASGVKQVDIDSTIELEENLDLINRLHPLQSSYTQSSSTIESSKPEEEKEENVQSNDDNNNNNNNDKSKEDESNKE